jgi:hypothetical protein
MNMAGISKRDLLGGVPAVAALGTTTLAASTAKAGEAGCVPGIAPDAKPEYRLPMAEGPFQESVAYTAQHLRFTTLGEPKQSVVVTSLGRAAGHESRRVKRVSLLGVKTTVTFQQADKALVIDLPSALPTRHASAFKITFQS